MYDFGPRHDLSSTRPAYRPQQINQCPGCGGSHWLVGRQTAECAFCGDALPLAGGAHSGIGATRIAHTPALAA